MRQSRYACPYRKRLYDVGRITGCATQLRCGPMLKVRIIAIASLGGATISIRRGGRARSGTTTGLVLRRPLSTPTIARRVRIVIIFMGINTSLKSSYQLQFLMPTDMLLSRLVKRSVPHLLFPEPIVGDAMRSVTVYASGLPERPVDRELFLRVRCPSSFRCTRVATSAASQIVAGVIGHQGLDSGKCRCLEAPHRRSAELHALATRISPSSREANASAKTSQCLCIGLKEWVLSLWTRDAITDARVSLN